MDPILAFVGGGAFFLGIKGAIGSIQRRLGASEESSGPLATFSGVPLDLLSDGVMIGTATVLNPPLGRVLTLGRDRYGA